MTSRKPERLVGFFHQRGADTHHTQIDLRVHAKDVGPGAEPIKLGAGHEHPDVGARRIDLAGVIFQSNFHAVQADGATDRNHLVELIGITQVDDTKGTTALNNQTVIDIKPSPQVVQLVDDRSDAGAQQRHAVAGRDLVGMNLFVVRLGLCLHGGKRHEADHHKGDKDFFHR